MYNQNEISYVHTAMTTVCVKLIIYIETHTHTHTHTHTYRVIEKYRTPIISSVRMHFGENVQ